MNVLESMRVYAEIADLGSYTAAASRLGISRAMASKHVADLEARLGARLINRTTRRLGLTEAGLEYLARCRDILEAVEEAEQSAALGAASASGVLRVSAPMSFGISDLAPLVERYLKANPLARLDLVLNDRFVDLVEEGFAMAVRIGRLAPSSLVARRIGATRLILCAAPAYLARAGTPARLADLAGHECLGYAQEGGGTVWRFGEGAGATTLTVRSRVTCNNGDALTRMALDGAGLVLQPGFVVGRFIAEGRLVEVLPREAVHELSIHAVHPGGRYVPRKVRAFIDYLADAMNITSRRGTPRN